MILLCVQEVDCTVDRKSSATSELSSDSTRWVAIEPHLRRNQTLAGLTQGNSPYASPATGVFGVWHSLGWRFSIELSSPNPQQSQARQHLAHFDDSPLAPGTARRLVGADSAPATTASSSSCAVSGPSAADVDTSQAELKQHQDQRQGRQGWQGQGQAVVQLQHVFDF